MPTLTGTVSLAGVSSSGANDAWAVSTRRPQRYTFNPLALHWNGTSWATSSISTGIPGGTYLVGAADIGPTDAYAFGDNTSAASGELAQWNGTAWSRVSYPLPTSTGFPNTLNAISADGPNDVWIVGSYMIQVSQTNLRYETFSDHWNGTSWSIAPSPGPGTENGLTGVTETSPNNLWAVGSSIPSGATLPQTLTLNYNGTAWSTVASPNRGSRSVLTSVSTTSGDAIVWAAGTSGTTGSFNPLILQNG